MAEVCKVGCELGKCQLMELGRLVTVAAELASAADVPEGDKRAVVDAHGKMLTMCESYAASALLNAARIADISTP